MNNVNTREQIDQALYNLLTGIQNPDQTNYFITVGRVWQPFNSVDKSLTPALFMTHRKQVAEKKGANQIKWCIYLDVHVYVNIAGNPTITIPATLLNNTIDLIDQTIYPGSGQIQTLGGMVSMVNIDGTIMTDEGTLGPQGWALAIIPIEIVTN